MKVSTRRSVFIRLTYIMILAALGAAGCSTLTQPAEPTRVAAEEKPTLTSILIDLQTPTPSPTPGPTFTPLPPTDTPTPDPGANDPDSYYGGLVISMEEVGKTMVMRPKGAFLLRLGQDYSWTVTVEPPDVLTLNKNVITEPGEQGVFIARKPGKATLRAVGDPICRQTDPPCARPSILFIFKVIVE